MPEPPHKFRSRSEPRTPKASLPGREPSHSADAVALLTQQSASSTLKARPAKLHHAAADADREDNHAPGSVSSAIICLTPRQRLDNSITSGLMQRSTICRGARVVARPRTRTVRARTQDRAISGPAASNARIACQATSHRASLGRPSRRVDNHPTS
jgi:hypothetical protein